MKHPFYRSLAAAVLLASCCGPAPAQTTQPVFPGKTQSTPIPPEYTDPETHHRVVHLSRFPNDYSGVVYFTYNNASPDSRLALIDAQFKDKWRYLYAFDFKAMTCTPLVTSELTQNQVVSKSGNVYYQTKTAAWVVPLAGGTPRKLCDLPERWAPGIGFTVNADETLLLGGSTDTDPAAALPADKVRNGPNVLYTIDLKTGAMNVIHRDTKWFGHVQFSPTDPDLCMFCHEGNWEKVDRIWLINPSQSKTDAAGNVTSNARVAFHRTEPREIAGHEFWRPDGKSIWFQHSYRGRPGTPGYLSALDVATGKVTNYTVPAGFGGIHESFSPDGTFLVADGSKGRDESTKYLSRLTLPTDGSTTLKGEHLMSLKDHDYAVEPNPHVSPDNKWVTFTATVHGTAQAYAVELP